VQGKRAAEQFGPAVQVAQAGSPLGQRFPDQQGGVEALPGVGDGEGKRLLVAVYADHQRRGFGVFEGIV